ncbi:MAG: hypothetical protein Ct9H300mP16_18580 [Pseudomonadota bacterium]|nr:MAG: hypothetical protein Ct9H300mP16_18580 [Pseudomonadota bacterium]
MCRCREAWPVPGSGGGPKTSRYNALLCIGSAQQGDQGFDHGIRLGVNLNRTSGKASSRSSSRGMGSRPPPLGHLDHRIVRLRDHTPLIGHPVQPVIVECEHLSAPRTVHIGLQVTKSLVNRAFKCGQRVLGAGILITPVGKASTPSFSRNACSGISVYLPLRRQCIPRPG